MPSIIVKSLNKLYQGTEQVNVLSNLNLEIRDGEFICVLGPSGCGKSTFLEILAGLQPATSGEVWIGNQKIKKASRNIGVVFQEASLFPWRTVLGNVEFGLEVGGINKKERQQRAIEYIRKVNLKGFENRYPHQLSGGMRQRAGLARTLAANPEILLMDEPFGSIDYLTRLQLQADVTSVCQKERKTVVFVTHDVPESLYLADRVVVFSPRPGRIRKIFDVRCERPREHGHPLLLELQKEIYEALNTRDATVGTD
jgi:NitT/TauT family transport system ATP-binding protein